MSTDMELGVLSSESEGLNRLFLALNSSLDGGGGFTAMVGASNAGSLSFRETCLVTISTSSFLALKIFPINMGMYSYPFLTLTTFEFHSFVRWLYFLVTMMSPAFVVAASNFKWKFQSMPANCFLALYAL